MNFSQWGWSKNEFHRTLEATDARMESWHQLRFMESHLLWLLLQVLMELSAQW